MSIIEYNSKIKELELRIKELQQEEETYKQVYSVHNYLELQNEYRDNEQKLYKEIKK